MPSFRATIRAPGQWHRNAVPIEMIVTPMRNGVALQGEEALAEARRIFHSLNPIGPELPVDHIHVTQIEGARGKS